MTEEYRALLCHLEKEYPIKKELFDASQLISGIRVMIDEFKYSTFTMDLACYILYRYLCVHTNYQPRLICACCVIIASEYYEAETVNVERYLRISGHTHTEYTFIRLKWDMLEALDYSVMLPNICRFITDCKYKDVTRLKDALQIVYSNANIITQYVPSEIAHAVDIILQSDTTDIDICSILALSINSQYRDQHSNQQYETKSMSTISTINDWSTYKKSADIYRRIRKINMGAYGVVYEAENLEQRCHVAIKKQNSPCSIADTRDENKDIEYVSHTIIRIMSACKVMDHPNIMKLIDFYMVQRCMHFVFPLGKMSLQDYIGYAEKGLPIHQIRDITRQILLGLQHMHNLGFIHRDIKPQNIIMYDNDIVKITDFDLIRDVSCISNCNSIIGTGDEKNNSCSGHQLTEYVATLWYRSVEILLGECKYTDKIDIWSVGCIICCMLIGYTLFTGDSPIDQLFMIFRVLGTPGAEDNYCTRLSEWKTTFPKWERGRIPKMDTHGTRNLEDLVLKMFKYNPSERISATQALAHPFFTDV